MRDSRVVYFNPACFCYLTRFEDYIQAQRRIVPLPVHTHMHESVNADLTTVSVVMPSTLTQTCLLLQ